MTTCIKCGRPVADGELFCAECDRNPDGIVTEPPRRTQTGRMQTPVKQAPGTVPQQRTAPAAYVQPEQQKPRLLGALIFVSVVAVLALAIAGILLTGRQKQRASLRLRESELEEREQYMDTLEQENEQLRTELSDAETTIWGQSSRIEELERSVDSAESSASQSQYDLSAQQAQLERLQQENDTLHRENDDLLAEKDKLETENETLSEEKEKLEKTSEEYEQKVNFMDSHVVFVENDGSNRYHRYDCPYFTQRSFWAYSKKLAESRGYDPCPYCCD